MVLLQSILICLRIAIKSNTMESPAALVRRRVAKKKKVVADHAEYGFTIRMNYIVKCRIDFFIIFCGAPIAAMLWGLFSRRHLRTQTESSDCAPDSLKSSGPPLSPKPHAELLGAPALEH